jgi:pyruvate carboxylase subunit B
LKYFVEIGSKLFSASVQRRDGRSRVVIVDPVDGSQREFDVASDGAFVLVGGKLHQVFRSGDSLNVRRAGTQVAVAVHDRAPLSEPPKSRRGHPHWTVQAPLPGRILRMAVSVGQQVGACDRLLVIEAMKMQNPMLCEHPARVTKLFVKEGQAVNTGDALLELEDVE